MMMAWKFGPITGGRSVQKADAAPSASHFRRCCNSDIIVGQKGCKLAKELRLQRYGWTALPQATPDGLAIFSMITTVHKGMESAPDSQAGRAL